MPLFSGPRAWPGGLASSPGSSEGRPARRKPQSLKQRYSCDLGRCLSTRASVRQPCLLSAWREVCILSSSLSSNVKAWSIPGQMSRAAILLEASPSAFTAGRASRAKLSWQMLQGIWGMRQQDTLMPCLWASYGAVCVHFQCSRVRAIVLQAGRRPCADHAQGILGPQLRHRCLEWWPSPRNPLMAPMGSRRCTSLKPSTPKEPKALKS